MVWGAISGNGQRQLTLCPKILNSLSYQEIIRTGLLEIYSETQTFIQDNAPCHRAKSTLTYFEDHGIMYMDDWPPNSPDINIIENLWATLKKHISDMKISSANDLWNKCYNFWHSIPNKTINSLFSSLLGRIKAVKKSNGHQTHY